MFSEAATPVNPRSMHLLRQWTLYPKSLITRSMLGEDREYYHRRLIEDSPRLFRNELGGLEITISGRNNSISKLSIQDRTGNRSPLYAAQQCLKVQDLDDLWQHLNVSGTIELSMDLSPYLLGR